MKLPAFTHHASRPRRREQGIAVIVVLALVFLVLIYLLGNVRTFTSLGGELKLLERQQTRRLQHSSPAANPPAATNANTNSVPVKKI